MEGGAVGHNFERDPPRFGLIWFSANWAYFEIEKRGDEILIDHCCFSISQNELKF
jgi:hypothetical protein